MKGNKYMNKRFISLHLKGADYSNIPCAIRKSDIVLLTEYYDKSEHFEGTRIELREHQACQVQETITEINKIWNEDI
jgi:hypothetical protein